MEARTPSQGPLSLEEIAASGMRKAAAARSLMAFCKIYLPHYLKAGGCQMHQDLCDLLQEASDRRGQTIVFAAPRGFAKSVYASLAYILWLIVHDREKRIVLVSDTERQVREMLDNIKTELTRNLLLRLDYSHACEPEGARPLPTRWTNEEVITRNNTKITGIPAEGSIRGSRHENERPSLVLCDDLENNEEAGSPPRVAKRLKWLLTEIYGGLSDNGNLIVLGTVPARECLMAQLLKPDSGWTRRRYKAIQDDGTALWEALWPVPKLEKRKSVMGTSFFMAEYMNDPVDPEDQLFKTDWRREYTGPAPEFRVVVMAVDPAACQTNYSDYFAVTVVGLDEALNFHVLEAYRGRLPSIPQQGAKIEEIYHRWRPIRIGIEEVAYQSMLGQHLRERGFPAEAIKPRKDKYLRAMELAVPFEQGKIFLKPSMNELWDELIQFPKAASHDDLLDALGFAVAMAQKYRHGPVQLCFEALRGFQPYKQATFECLDMPEGGLSGDQREDMAKLTETMRDVPKNVIRIWREGTDRMC